MGACAHRLTIIVGIWSHGHMAWGLLYRMPNKDFLTKEAKYRVLYLVIPIVGVWSHGDMGTWVSGHIYACGFLAIEDPLYWSPTRDFSTKGA